ncbi:MAG: hypothetical protein QW551_07235 [Desulfurococcaceae archaeon]
MDSDKVDKIYPGGLKTGVVKARELIVHGPVEIGLAISDNAIIIGKGRISMLICLGNCILMSMNGLLHVDKLHGINALILGSKKPVYIGSLRTMSLYADKAIIGVLEAKYAVLGNRCIVDRLEKTEKLVFTDPHVYMKSIGEIGETQYTYELLE